MDMMNQLKTWFFLLGLPLAILLLGDLIAHEIGVCVAIFLIILMYIGAFSANTVVLNLYGARKADSDEASQLKTIVTSLAQKAGLPVPTIYLIKADSPNAFSIGHHKAKAG